MNTGKKHVIPHIKNMLRAVAVVVINIKNRHPRATRIAQRLRGNRCVIQEAVAAKKIAPSVMSGRTREHECALLPRVHQINRSQCAIGTTSGRRPRSGGQRRARVERIQAHACRKIFRLNIGSHAANRPGRGKGVPCTTERYVFSVGTANEIDVALTVHLEKDHIIVRGRCDNLSQRCRLNSSKHPISALRFFKSSYLVTTKKFVLGTMQRMGGVVNRFHRAILPRDVSFCDFVSLHHGYGVSPPHQTRHRPAFG